MARYYYFEKMPLSVCKPENAYRWDEKNIKSLIKGYPKDLVESIRKYGILDPAPVQLKGYVTPPKDIKEYYPLIWVLNPGVKRWTISKYLGKDSIRCMVKVNNHLIEQKMFDFHLSMYKHNEIKSLEEAKILFGKNKEEDSHNERFYLGYAYLIKCKWFTDEADKIKMWSYGSHMDKLYDNECEFESFKVDHRKYIDYKGGCDDNR